MKDLGKIKELIGRIKKGLFKEANRELIGNLKSNFKGQGIHFKDHRIYSHGDDLRQIDWKILAKTQNPYIKNFEEERNVEITILLDLNLSMFYGFNGVTKIDAAIDLCCLLYLLCEETRDDLTVYIIGSQVFKVPKRRGEQGIYELFIQLNKIGSFDNAGVVNLNYRPDKVLTKETKKREVLKYLKVKTEVIIFSDFNEFIDEETLIYLNNTKNILFYQILSPLDELGLKNEFLFFTNDLENKLSGKIPKMKKKPFNLKKLSKIFIQENYLENFIKGLI